MSFKSNSRVLYGLFTIALLSTSLFMALLPNLVSGTPVQPWLTGWQYRKSHVVNGTGTTAGTNYPVKINVYYSNYTSIGSVATKSPMPMGLSDLPGVAYNNKVYTFGGYGTSGSDIRNNVYSYDPSTDSWASLASMTYARWGAAAAVYGGIAYVFGGSPSYVEAYNISSNSWTTKNSLPGPISAQGLMAVTVGTKIHLFCYQYAYQYDPSADTYTALTNLPTGYSLTWATCAYVNVGGEDRIYLIGGYNYGAGGGGTNAVMYYRPANNDWVQPSTTAPYAAYGTTRDNPVIGGKIYYGYGNSAGSSFFYASMYAYDPATNTWTQLTSGTYPRDGMACGVVNGKLYVIGGRNVESGPFGTDYNECFDPNVQNPLVDNGPTVTANMKCKTDFGDIRFTASDGTTQLNYWMQSYTVGVVATFWVKIADNLSGASSTIYLYYGNPSATTTSNGAAVWTLFDDFEGATPLSNYNAEVGSSSFAIVTLGSNHVLSYTGPIAWFLFVRTTPTFQDMRMIATMMPRGSPNYYTGLGFRETASSTWYFSWLAFDGTGYQGSPGGTRNDWDRRVGGTDAYIAGGSTPNLLNTWSTMEVDMAGSSCKTYVDGAKKADATNTAITSAGKIGFMGLYASYWDNLCVGSYVNPEPAHGSWGTEETNSYTLTVSTVGGGSVELDVAGPYHYGDVVHLTAHPSTDWSFDHWSDDLTGSDNPAALTITGDMVVTATFIQSLFTLTVSTVGGGSVELDVAGPYHYGDVVHLTAHPSTGWSFDHWSEDLTGSTNPAPLTITRNMFVTATFTQDLYTLTVSVAGQGNVNLDNNGPYHYGDVVQLRAVPATGWNFDHWSGNLIGSINPAALTITGNMAVTANFEPTRIYVNPSSVQKGPGDVYTTFQTDVMVERIADLWGFDFTVTWDNSLIVLTHVDFDAELDNIWGHGNWYLAYNVTGPGYYELAVVGTSTGFTTTAPAPLGTLTFLVKAAVGQTAIHFAEAKLSNSQAQQIPVQIDDGTYQVTGPQYQPMLQMTPGSVTCRKYGEYFTVQVNVTNAITLDDFSFTIHYDAALINYVGVTWGELGSGTITNVDPVNGVLEGNVAGPMISGNRWLLNITFQDRATLIWKDGQPNKLEGKIWFHYAKLSFSGVQDLVYEEGGLGQISVNDVAFAFAPIQGDLDNSGEVDISDLRTVAAYYDVKQGDPMWPAASAYDLYGDGVIDIFDLVVVGSNFGYKYSL
jgi:hypothetical protein